MSLVLGALEANLSDSNNRN